MVKATQNNDDKITKIKRIINFVNTGSFLKKLIILLKFIFFKEYKLFLTKKIKIVKLIMHVVIHKKIMWLEVKILKNDSDSVKITTSKESTNTDFTKANLKFVKTASLFL